MLEKKYGEEGGRPGLKYPSDVSKSRDKTVNMTQTQQ